MTSHSLFPPRRDAALLRLRDFLPHAGRAYASKRNYCLPEQGHPHVSGLSPYLRHRMLTEAEVVDAVLRRHSPSASEKFLQEVFWRTYWKGWIERRPTKWTAYQLGLRRCLDEVQTQAGLRRRWEDACTGRTGIDGFDDWAQELVETGYMHNHARMWFASIWIFTLQLPWELGADFFMRHLLDGDAASNTLSWRWVAGLQTVGKNYVAQATNIQKYTDGRHFPERQLALDPKPLTGPPIPPAGPVPVPAPPDASTPWALLLTEDDLTPGYVLDQMAESPSATAIVTGVSRRSPLLPAAHVSAWTGAAIDATVTRYRARLGPVTRQPDSLAAWAQDIGVHQIVVPYVPVGPAADAVATHRPALAEAGIALVPVLRDWDAAAWPHATAGFFKFKTHIPQLVERACSLNAIA